MEVYVNRQAALFGAKRNLLWNAVSGGFTESTAQLIDAS